MVFRQEVQCRRIIRAGTEKKGPGLGRASKRMAQSNGIGRLGRAGKYLDDARLSSEALKNGVFSDSDARRQILVAKGGGYGFGYSLLKCVRGSSSRHASPAWSGEAARVPLSALARAQGSGLPHGCGAASAQGRAAPVRRRARQASLGRAQARLPAGLSNQS